MFLTISNSARVERAALFVTRVAVGAPVSRSDGGIWDVSDPLCHSPITVPRSVPAIVECAACVHVIRVDGDRA
jgi:hypothetical protein